MSKNNHIVLNLYGISTVVQGEMHGNVIWRGTKHRQRKLCRIEINANPSSIVSGTKITRIQYN
jgi:hypothetical protein